MSVENLITEHLDIWTSAIKTKSAAGRGTSKKLELVGIKKLRELILELAVRGKLVPQDPNDEPASELLKKIETEKARLVEEGKIKKQKPSPKIKEEERLYSMPNGWDWTRLGEVTEIVRGITFPSSEKSKTPQEGRLACLRTTNVQEQIFWDDMLYIRDQFVKRDDQYILKNDIVMSMANSRELVGKVAIIEKTPHLKTTFGGFLGVIRPLHLLASFVMCLLRAPTNRERLIGSASQTTNIANISLAKLNPMVFSIPPLAEQHRIVAKVDELMVLCDQLEAQTENSIQAHQLLVETLLATLTNAKDADELSESWQRISRHFDLLFVTQDSIDQLKQTILQLAVMGKLVKQDPNDEHASKLLERIAAEKEQLINHGKIKKQKPLPPITDEEKPFGLPEGWSFARLDSICAWITSGSTPPKSDFHETNGVPYLKVYNIKNQKIDFDYKPQFVTTESHQRKLKRSILFPGDVVMNIVGPPLGKVAIIPDSYSEWNCNQAIAFFRPLDIRMNSFLYTYLSAKIFLNFIELIGTAGQDNISITKSRTIVFPVPPIAEQELIVAKVNKLMMLCDSLQTRQNEAQSIKLQISNTLVEEALG